MEDGDRPHDAEEAAGKAPEDSAEDAAEQEAADAEARDPGDEAERQAAEDEVREAEEENEFGIDQKRMPFTEHLVELRFRILVCLATVGGMFLLFFFLLRHYIYDAMTLPVLRACNMLEIDFNTLLALGALNDGQVVGEF